MMQLPVCTTKKLDEHATFYDIPRRIHHGNPVFNSHILPTLFSKKKTHTVWCAFLFIINTRFRYPSPGEVPARFDAVLPFAERKVSNPSSRIRAKPHRGFAVSSSNLPVSTKKSEPKRVPTFFVVSVHFRYCALEQIPARFVCNFSSLQEEKLEVRLRQAVGGNCPPDSCI